METQSKNSESINSMKNTGSRMIATAVSSFGNSHHGGFVHIGINSNGIITGLEKDKEFAGFDDYNDSFANHIRNKLIQEKCNVPSGTKLMRFLSNYFI